MDTNLKEAPRTNWKRDRKTWIAAGAIAVAILLPTGRWVLAARQDAADEKASREVERQFQSRQVARNGGGTTQAGGNPQQGWGGPGGGRGRGRQGRGGGGQRGQGRARMMAEMVKEVGLNEMQVKQLQAVQESSRPMMQDLFRNPQLSREQKMEAMQQMRAQQQAQISKFLTPDQQTKYAAFQQKMRAQWQARRQANGGERAPGRGGQD